MHDELNSVPISADGAPPPAGPLLPSPRRWWHWPFPFTAAHRYGRLFLSYTVSLVVLELLQGKLCLLLWGRPKSRPMAVAYYHQWLMTEFLSISLIQVGAMVLLGLWLADQYLQALGRPRPRKGLLHLQFWGEIGKRLLDMVVCSLWAEGIVRLVGQVMGRSLFIWSDYVSWAFAMAANVFVMIGAIYGGLIGRGPLTQPTPGRQLSWRIVIGCLSGICFMGIGEYLWVRGMIPRGSTASPPPTWSSDFLYFVELSAVLFLFVFGLLAIKIFVLKITRTALPMAEQE